jgi:dihydroorotate dehydrogenase electron transfer subunit
MPSDRHLSLSDAGGLRLRGRVVANEAVGPWRRLTLEIHGWSGSRPGQFVLLQAGSSRCFLARAISVSDEAGERVSFIIAPVGGGTEELCGLAEAEAAWVLGPLGNGFDIDALVTNPGRVVVVAGGVGLAPFPLLLSRLGAVATTAEILVLLGVRDATQAEAAGPLQAAVAGLSAAGVSRRLEIATEDGSRGAAEKVTDLLARHVRPGDRLVVCGPEAMAKAVWQVCRAVPDVQSWFSLETKMACGVGSCHGCVITLADGSYARVCHDGPVFGGVEVFGG